MLFEQWLPPLEYLYQNLQGLTLLSEILLDGDEGVVATMLRVSRRCQTRLVIPTGEYTVSRRCYSPSGKRFVV
jgi:hypothetical protein